MSDLQDDFDLDEFESEIEEEYTQTKKEKVKKGCDSACTTKESIENMIESILTGNLVESRDVFANVISAKIALKLEERKILVGKQLFGIQESKDHDDDDYDYKAHDSDDDDDYNKSLHGRLKTAEDMDANPLKDDEKENPNDKRVQAGLAARAAKGELSKPNQHRDIPLTQGSVTLNDGDAKRINAFLAGLKPAKRQEVIDHMQKSPTHFDAVHDVIKKFPAPKQNKSIY